MRKKHLECQSCFSGSISQRSNASMVLAVTAVEADFLDASLPGFFRNRPADHLGRFLVSTVSDSIAQVLVPGAGGNHSRARSIVDQLTTDVL
jgi:hypothetical protein